MAAATDARGRAWKLTRVASIRARARAHADFNEDVNWAASTSPYREGGVEVSGGGRVRRARTPPARRDGPPEMGATSRRLRRSGASCRQRVRARLRRVRAFGSSASTAAASSGIWRCEWRGRAGAREDRVAPTRVNRLSDPMLVVAVAGTGKEATMLRASPGGRDAAHSSHRSALIEAMTLFMAPLFHVTTTGRLITPLWRPC